ncbi:MAG TPA: DNA polymerase III subunit gamma/tau [Pyrinomonadaceae bacterium]|jgi:DNA polymerase-3 subunit gamma/tau|nr:DNA polymerase III subunit gamma/tau [Pyrinomonadaceae bacterium]
MTYQVIARKWRPQTFEEVTGQEHITRTLRNAVEHERLHHAYLFSGARGVGKTTTARLLAKAVNCHKADRPTPTPCRTTDADACASCREIAEGRSIDVLEIDAASNTGVDNVRDAIINTVGVRPARDRYKVFIVDEVHMLSTPAFNALLKTLEEPPSRVLFIMATTHAHKVPETILSRSQQFEFRTIAAARIAERLRLIADAEGIKVSDDALREIARAGEGSMRDAQSAFDQVISFSEGAIETGDVEAALGIAGAEVLARVVRAVAAEKPAEALAVVEDLVMRGHDLRNFCRDLLAHLRDLLIFKIAGDSSALADTTESGRRELMNEAREFSESDLVRFFHSLTETETRLRESAHPRYQLEIGLVKLVEMRRLAPLGQIIERLNALEESLRGGRAPAAGAGGGGTQTPPASSAGVPPRRGGAVGGGRGPASLSAEASGNTAPPRNGFAASAGATNGEGNAGAQASSRPTPPADAPARTRAVVPASPDDDDAVHTPAGSTPNLKLVPPPAMSPGGAPSSAGGAPSFAGDGASRAGDAPFALGGDAPLPPAGVDRVGLPVALVASQATACGAGAAVAPEVADAPAASAPEVTRVNEEAGDAVSRIKQKLEERGKPLLAVAVEGARRVRVEGEEVRVEFAPEGKYLHDTLRKPESQRLLREVCCEVLGRGVGVAVVFRAPGESDDEALAPEDEAQREQRRMRARAEEHPVVQKLLKTFRAEIVDVRRTDNAPQ